MSWPGRRTEGEKEEGGRRLPSSRPGPLAAPRTYPNPSQLVQLESPLLYPFLDVPLQEGDWPRTASPVGQGGARSPEGDSPYLSGGARSGGGGRGRRASASLYHSLSTCSTLDSSAPLERWQQQQLLQDAKLPGSGSGDGAATSSRHHISRLLRKLDWYILPCIWLVQCFNILHRVNIANAAIISSPWGDMRRDLGLTHSQYGFGMSVFFIGYIAFQVPSNLVLKRWTPSKWIGLLVIGFSLVATAFAFLSDFPGLVALRVLLGALQAGVFPGLVYYLAYWYHPHELATRMSILTSSTALSGALGGLMGYIMAQADGWMGLPGWRMLFFVEGLPALFLGVCTFFTLPDYPFSAPFLTVQERGLATARASNSTTAVQRAQPFEWGQLWRTLVDPQTWTFAVLQGLLFTPIYGLAFSMPTLVRNMGFSALDAQLLSIPHSVMGSVSSILLGILSDRVKDRFWILFGSFAVAFGAFLALTLTQEASVHYALILVANMALSPTISLVLTWMSNNTLGSTRKSVATALVISCGNVGGYLGAQGYAPWDAPYYPHGHRVMMACAGVAMGLVVVLKVAYVVINRRRDAAHGAPAGSKLQQEVVAAVGGAPVVERERDIFFRYQE